MLMNLLRLSVILDRKDLADAADQLQRAFASRVGEHPTASERMLAAVDFYWSRPKEIVLLAATNDADLAALRKAVWQTYVPNRVVVGAVGSQFADAARKIPRAGRPQAEQRQGHGLCLREYGLQAAHDEIRGVVEAVVAG